MGTFFFETKKSTSGFVTIGTWNRRRPNSSVPLTSRCVPQAELLHDALVSILNKQGIRDCPALVGKDAAGRKLQDGHGHAHHLPLDLDDDDTAYVSLPFPVWFGGAVYNAVHVSANGLFSFDGDVSSDANTITGAFKRRAGYFAVPGDETPAWPRCSADGHCRLGVPERASSARCGQPLRRHASG